MNTIKMVENELGIDIKEFTVAGKPQDINFSHTWYIGCDNQIEDDIIRDKIDEKLKLLNDDYRTERGFALKHINLKRLPADNFYEWMRINGKEGGQNKFPRVIKDEKCADWEMFVQQRHKSQFA